MTPRDDIVPIADAASLRAAMAAVESLEEDPRETALLASLGFDGPLRHYAALRDGVPVGIASAFAWRSAVTLTARPSTNFRPKFSITVPP